MIKIFATVLLSAAVLGCGPVPQGSRGNITATSAANTATDTREPIKRELSIDDVARAMVGFDDGKLPPADDIRVFRARYLIQSLSNYTGERPLDVSHGIDAAVQMVRQKFGRELTRLQLAEDLKGFYDKGIDDRKTPVKEAAGLYAIMKYGK